ncbi:hypothetical protein Lal_00019392 [Lupinus albus]|nr:hypothetical protein Lal_00019392 [Lupinus albus]
MRSKRGDMRERNQKMVEKIAKVNLSPYTKSGVKNVFNGKWTSKTQKGKHKEKNHSDTLGGGLHQGMSSFIATLECNCCLDELSMLHMHVLILSMYTYLMMPKVLLAKDIVNAIFTTCLIISAKKNNLAKKDVFLELKFKGVELKKYSHYRKMYFWD